MPIYAYKCESCGHGQDVLQKISDPVLTDCPQCGQSSFRKQITAAGFQLKGTGWYVTDFRGGGSSSSSSGSASSSGNGSSETSAKSETKAEAASSGGACGSSCACH
ncbi:zinc ribbon domain-containing protein [Caldimonas thermodepolymerans]|jgi:putative FmdB family regulatory protein|uniref:FmdB family regulatory protein n=1 Tax=Caldimonas thermodepolymerans TaxID=215580 RepID=A0A2S5T934_9BURK|nr:FmdB family zinc ribbon protein [Caldimonas thermodepolymerans]PPE71378.1 FmdB family transcriptional regulator [Caldimonas thermodepolymerans]QPC32554.1 zinc ribbon domain-containing protein [Caldimonas thermodepolymerans]RDH98951.1 putative FmdB family regulatory protein [Caldimonas thermodepolymerans]TCP06350.1 putative FmdB family regulatory protein [Caldimonas thermodepolymerans]UZG45354.1 zinc ribbon domain-containing protein [Caldimonas thermodepolymerans]